MIRLMGSYVRCVACPHYDPDEDGICGEVLGLQDDDPFCSTARGACRFNPPVVKVLPQKRGITILVGFPHVERNGWCGQHPGRSQK